MRRASCSRKARVVYVEDEVLIAMNGEVTLRDTLTSAALFFVSQSLPLWSHPRPLDTGNSLE
jgi:hypothetical protein